MPTPRTMWWQCRRCLRTVKAPFLYSSLTCPQCGFACYIPAEEPRVSVRASWGKRLLAAVVLLMILGLSVASDAFGYIQNITKTGYPFHWATEQVTFHVNMGAPWDGLVKDAVTEWNTINAPFHITLVVGDPAAPASCAEDDKWNTIRWSSVRCNGDPYGDAVAFTWYSYLSWKGQINEIDIRFNQNGTWSAEEFYHAALHELGHAVGLGHPNEHGQEVRAVMNQKGAGLYESNVLHPHLQLDDRHGIRGIYGTLWWNDTDYPTETLGAWMFVHPETGQTVRFILTHIREYESGIWARNWQEGRFQLAIRSDLDRRTWDTHFFVLDTPAEPTCTRMWLLYEGPTMFSGRLSIGTTRGEEGVCTVWPSDRYYDVELYRQ